MTDLEWGAVDTPLGRMYVAASGAGLARVRLPGSQPPAGAALSPSPGAVVAGAVVAGATAELGRYFSGAPITFRTPIDWSVVAGFRRDVLAHLFDHVGWGQVTTYGELAAAVDSPDAARAVGEVMASNPLSIVVPCHRVLASRGAIGGYGGGLEMKRALLALEGVLPPMLEFEP